VPGQGIPLFLSEGGRDIVGTVVLNEDHFVDAFVEYLNAAGFEPKMPKDVPEELRTSTDDSEQHMFSPGMLVRELFTFKLRLH